MRERLRTELLVDFWRRRWIFDRLEKPEILDAVSKHRSSIRYAQVILPDE
jgi:hypothetical protein